MRIDLLMTLRIMLLDMFKHRRLPKGRYIPIQFPQPFMQIRITGSYIADIAFEVLHVDGVEADYGCVETDVGFGYGGAEVVGGGVGGEVGFCAVEGGEEGVHGFFVGFLGSKAGKVGGLAGEGIGIFEGGRGKGGITWRIRICRRRCLCRCRSSRLLLRSLLGGAGGRGLFSCIRRGACRRIRCRTFG